MTSTGRRGDPVQFAQRKTLHVALAADRLEGCGLRNRHAGRDGAQGIAERVGIVGLDGRDAARAEAKAGKDRFRKRNGAVRPVTSCRGFARSRKRNAEAP